MKLEPNTVAGFFDVILYKNGEKKIFSEKKRVRTRKMGDWQSKKTTQFTLRKLRGIANLAIGVRIRN